MRPRTALLLATLPVAIAASIATADTVEVEWTGDFPIPDIEPPPGVFIDIEVEPHPSGADIIRDVDLGFRIPHTWQGDLSIMLEHRDSGRLAPLTARPGSPECAGRYGYSADNYGDASTGEPFVIDDEAPLRYDMPDVECHGIPDVIGHWKPDTPLAVFDGGRIAGTWRMWIADEAGGDIGRVRYIVLRFDTHGCANDIDGDGAVGLEDLLVVLAEWGRCPPDCHGDVDEDGDVDLDDLLSVLAAWGSCPG